VVPGAPKLWQFRPEPSCCSISGRAERNNVRPVEELAKLGQLRDAGVINNEEFEAAKRKLLF